MSIAALLLAVTAGQSDGAPPAQAAGAVLASARVGVTIVRAASVRQGQPLEPQSSDAPRAQITRRGGEILIEFQ